MAKSGMEEGGRGGGIIKRIGEGKGREIIKRKLKSIKFELFKLYLIKHIEASEPKQIYSLNVWSMLYVCVSACLYVCMLYQYSVFTKQNHLSVHSYIVCIYEAQKPKLLKIRKVLILILVH